MSQKRQPRFRYRCRAGEYQILDGGALLCRLLRGYHGPDTAKRVCAALNLVHALRQRQDAAPHTQCSDTEDCGVAPLATERLT